MADAPRSLAYATAPSINAWEMPCLRVPRAHAEAPQRPHIEIIDVRDQPISSEARLPSGMHGGPPDRCVVEIRDHTGRRVLTAQLAHAVGASAPLQRHVPFAADAIAEAEADIR
ncbi:hypothetical protein GCM10010213_09520 [Microbacterium maritypicum]|uniref:Uncharacterized protein n=1 Tax=Microbacterium maritypicum TaxID=33918 RepID=A0A4Y4B708_MICMQ|nr:hypothetical protein MLI01_10750 [Microbacterium liquefaciens]GGV52936.1 hypothetical protein GCM10010213_09520 [Microbacterium liquefaciens]